MTYVNSTKSKSIELRKDGFSYNIISQQLGIPKSTLSGWLKDLPLSKIAKQKNIKKARLAAAKNISDLNHRRAKEYQAKVRAELSEYAQSLALVNSEALLWLGIALFLAEGGKREKWSVRLVNSDPLIIKIMMKFFGEVCGVESKKFKFRIHLHKNIKHEKALKFWSKIVSIPEKQFYKSYSGAPITSQGKRPINRLPYGTLHVIINDAGLVRKLRGWIMGLQKQFEMPS